MRLDKFLKVSRLIKRRTVAKEIADKGRIQVNGKLAKSSTTLKTSDVLTIRFGNKILEAKVLELSENVRKEEAERLYEILSEKRTDNDGGPVNGE
jgi:ribosomal 50S subunit-recycling heat shock protein